MKPKISKNLKRTSINESRSTEQISAIEEHLVRAAVRKIIKETIEQESPTNLFAEVEKFFKSNKKKLEKLADEDEWDDFYELAYEKFPDVEQDKVAQALNKVCMYEGWFEEEQLNEIPSEKELEQMAFGDKSQQKGIKMGDYDKKNKSPKQSPSELFAESKKKIQQKR
jgi:hypothetical protein